MRKLDGCLCANCGDLDYHTYKQAQLLQKMRQLFENSKKQKPAVCSQVGQHTAGLVIRDFL